MPGDVHGAAVGGTLHVFVEQHVRVAWELRRTTGVNVLRFELFRTAQRRADHGGRAGGTGNGTVSISIAQNTSTSSRTGTVTIAGQTFTVQQSAAPCTYTEQRFFVSWELGGTTGVNVVSASNCSWTATSNTAWITVSGGASGNGNGTVSISMAEYVDVFAHGHGDHRRADVHGAAVGGTLHIR